MADLLFRPVFEDLVRVGEARGMGLGDGPVAGLLNDIQRKMEGVRPAVDVFLLRTRRSAALDAEGVQYGLIFFMVEIGAVFRFLYGGDAFLGPA